jgi:hypothetical protein
MKSLGHVAHFCVLIYSTLWEDSLLYTTSSDFSVTANFGYLLVTIHAFLLGYQAANAAFQR